jgi:hypothetical protein
MFRDVVSHIETHEQYHARRELSTSMVKDWIHSPEMYHRRNVLGIKKKATDPMDFGNAVHEDQLLSIWEQTYIVIPKEVLATNGARRGNAWDAFKAANEGKVLLKEQDVADLVAIRESIAANPDARYLLESEGLSEVSLVGWADLPGEEGAGTHYRGRLDRVMQAGERRIVDLKTTGDMSPRAMRYKPLDSCWDISGMAYSKMWEAMTGELLPVDFIVVETCEPYRVEVYSPSKATLAMALDRWLEAVIGIQSAVANGYWHRDGYPARIMF